MSYIIKHVPSFSFCFLLFLWVGDFFKWAGLLSNLVLYRLQDHMGCHQHLLGVPSLYSIKQPFLTLQKESGSPIVDYDLVSLQKRNLLDQHWFLTCMFCSSRIASRSITLADSLSDDLCLDDASQRTRIQPPNTDEMSVSSLSVLSRLKEKVVGLWSFAVQRWPSVCPLPYSHHISQFEDCVLFSF